jgi:hypothetical protein
MGLPHFAVFTKVPAVNAYFRRDSGWFFFFVAAVALGVGVLLRTHLLGGQILVDDEWHGFYYAIGKSPLWLLTHFSVPGATSIPLNFYAWCLGAAGGWSETGLRLPSLAGGVLGIVAGPLLARKLIGTRSSAWLALLLAISPLLIFYSRLYRPYSAVALLGFAALLLAEHWRQTGGWRPALGFVITGTLAIYFHLFAAITVAAPVLMALAAHGYWRLRKMPRGAGPSLGQWLGVAAGLGVAGAMLILPALIDSLRHTLPKVMLAGTFQFQAWPKAALLVSGTGQPWLAGLFWLTLIIGAWQQCRRNPWFGAMLVSLYPLHAAALLLSRPQGAQSAIVLVRYAIPLVPVSLLFVACGMQSVLEYLARRMALKPALQTLLAVAGVTVLFSAGPLAQYVAPNNFTNHGAFQQSYAPIDWRRSFKNDVLPPNFKFDTSIRIDEVSPFYGRLAAAPGLRPIVEYPMMIGDHYDPLYYYQHFHRRPVLVGYTLGVKLAYGPAVGNVFDNTYIDQVLSLVDNPATLQFHNLICMDDLAAMRQRGVEYIILHKRYEAQVALAAWPLPDLARLCLQYQAMLGAPVYEDANLIVFHP